MGGRIAENFADMLTFREFYQSNFSSDLPLYLQSESKKRLMRLYEFACALDRVKKDTIWKESIALIREEGWKIDRMMMLADQIKEANKDNPGLMRSILGIEYDNIIKS